MEHFEEPTDLPEFSVFDTLPEVPKQCENCPYLEGVKRNLIRHKLAIDFISRRAMSDELEDYVKNLQEASPDIFEDTTAEEFVKELRQVGYDRVEVMSQQADSIEEDIAMLTQECPGILKARIKSQADHSVYTQRICRTPMTLIGKEIMRPVWQTRERLQDE